MSDQHFALFWRVGFTYKLILEFSDVGLNSRDGTPLVLESTSGVLESTSGGLESTSGVVEPTESVLQVPEINIDPISSSDGKTYNYSNCVNMAIIFQGSVGLIKISFCLLSKTLPPLYIDSNLFFLLTFSQYIGLNKFRAKQKYTMKGCIAELPVKSCLPKWNIFWVLTCAQSSA